MSCAIFTVSAQALFEHPVKARGNSTQTCSRVKCERGKCRDDGCSFLIPNSVCSKGSSMSAGRVLLWSLLMLLPTFTLTLCVLDGRSPQECP